MDSKYCYALVLVVIGGLLGTVLPNYAQADWAAYLYTSNNSQLVQVGPDGERAKYSLGVNIEAGEWVNGFDLAVTPDGARVAFCFVTNTTSADGTSLKTQATYVLRDIAAEQDIVRLDMGSPLSCLTGETAFNPAGTSLTLAKVNSYPGDPNTDPNTPYWSLQIIDPLTGDVQAELNQHSPQLAAIGIDPFLTTNPIIPLVLSFDDSGVIFTVAPFASEGRLDAAYRWDFTSGAVIPATPWDKYGLSRQTASGEFVYADLDPALPVGEPGGPMANNNVVRVQDTTGAPRTVFIGGSDWIVVNTAFVNQGRDLAINLLQSFVPSNDPQATQQLRWILLRRDGTQVELYADPDYAELAAVDNGYILLMQDFQRDQPNTYPSYNLIYGDGNEQRVIWELPPIISYQNWEIVWGTPTTMQADLPPFTAVN
ncbi:MAG: hypothetical protein R3E39_15170 [Anaerolineae bacterium]